MKQSIIYFQVIFIGVILFACSTRRIVINTKSFWDDRRYIFHQSDSLLIVKSDERDKYPDCENSKNNVDSLKEISFRYIDSIEKNYFTSFLKRYEYDSLSGYDLNELKKTDKKKARKVWNHSSFIREHGDTTFYINQKTIRYDFQKIYYDSVSSFIYYNCYSECDNYFQQAFTKPLFHKFDLKLFRVTLKDYEIKVKGKYSKIEKN